MTCARVGVLEMFNSLAFQFLPVGDFWDADCPAFVVFPIRLCLFATEKRCCERLILGSLLSNLTSLQGFLFGV